MEGLASSAQLRARLRARVPRAVVAQERPATRVIRPIALRAVSVVRAAAAAVFRCRRIGPVIPFVGGIRTVAAVAISAVVVRCRQRAADQSAGGEADAGTDTGATPAAAMMVAAAMMEAAAVPAATTTVAAPSRRGRTCGRGGQSQRCDQCNCGFLVLHD